ncbi:DUF6221 family protein [Streptomyces sp. NPDC018019]|uniref:DUF6221 family protein n=1 Tax=Streptomyces sp. NPDC018019 TaxID=3365030 RepID=UPI0037AE4A64
MTDGLAVFLRARVAEDMEAAADAAVAGWDDRDVDAGSPVARHVVRHDPARVLIEAGSQKRIIEEHAPSRPEYLKRTERGCQTCCTAQAWDAQANESNCLTLRLLARPYDDHPDFREEWRS